MKAIAIVSDDWGIGADGMQLIVLHKDLQHFRRLTEGGTIIYGRHTLLTFPHQRPLSNRRNLILSRTLSRIEGAEVYSSINSLMADAPSDSWVIGGAEVFKQLLPLCSMAYITKVNASFGADTFIDNLEISPGWEEIEHSALMEECGIYYRFVTYCNTVNGI